MKLKDVFSNLFGVSRTTDSIDTRRLRSDSSPNRPRDVKRKRELRKLKEDGRRKSMPPELDRFQVGKANKRSTNKENGSKDEFLFVSPIRNFNERAVDCEGIYSTKRASATIAGIGRLRAASEPRSEHQKRRRRPLSLGGLQSLFSTKRDDKELKYDSATATFTTSNSHLKLKNRQPIDEQRWTDKKESHQVQPPPSILNDERGKEKTYGESAKNEGRQYADVKGESNSSIRRSPNVQKRPVIVQKPPEDQQQQQQQFHQKQSGTPVDDQMLGRMRINGAAILSPKKTTTPSINGNSSVRSLRANDSKENFRRDFVKGLWSADAPSSYGSDCKDRSIESVADSMQQTQRTESHHHHHQKPTTVAADPLYSSIDEGKKQKHKRNKSCEGLVDSVWAKTKAEETLFNSFFTESTSTLVSTDSAKSPRPNETVKDWMLVPEESTATNPYNSSSGDSRPASNARERSASQPVSTGVSKNASVRASPCIAAPEWTLDLAPCKVGSELNWNVTENNSKAKQPLPVHSECQIVVAIDFGTTNSGYAYAFWEDQSNITLDHIYIMQKFDAGEPGVGNAKCPTCLLLSPDGRFHSFGLAARNFYHDLDLAQAKQYLYFERFKMELYNNKDLKVDTCIKAANGRFWPALDVIGQCLRFFKRRAILELSDRIGFPVDAQSIRWVVTVPSIWLQEAKQLMREAAYQAGLASPVNPGQLLIALEAEAAALFCRELRLYNLAAESVKPFFTLPSPVRKEYQEHLRHGTIKAAKLEAGDSYVLVDCGGGTVDITVHQIAEDGHSLKELTKASGGPHGASAVDSAFESILCDIFSKEFMDIFHERYPAAWVDLLMAFESRKRSAHPYKLNPVNVALPFSFLEFHKKSRGYRVDNAVQKYKSQNVTWNSHGMLRLSPEALQQLFEPTIEGIVAKIQQVLRDIPSILLHSVKYFFLVGGFSESPMLQNAVKNVFGTRFQVIIPQEQVLAVVKGAVLFGLDPGRISLRRSRFTYGIGVLHRFDPVLHPPSKRIVKQGSEWCTDVFDPFVLANQPLAPGDHVTRRYCPATVSQREIVIQIFCSEKERPQFVTDPGVRKCAMLRLALPVAEESQVAPKQLQRREVETSMRFGETEITVAAVEKVSGAKIHCGIDFLTL